jgi:glycosyltransferase involved in cell wall biosynthesis
MTTSRCSRSGRFERDVRICLVSQEYPPDTALGGIGTQTQLKARELARRGHDVHVLSAATEPGGQLESEQRDGALVHRIPEPDDLMTDQGYWLGYSFALLRTLRELETERRFDLIDFPDYGGEGFCYLADREPSCWSPVVVHLHGSLAMFARHVGWPELESRFYRVGGFMEELAIREADCLLASSEAIAEFAGEHYAVDPDQIEIVSGGVDSALFSAGPEPEGPPTVLFVGNIQLNKGIATIADAVLELRSSHPDLRLVVAGSGDHELQAELEVRGAGIVEFLGFVDHDKLPELYRQAHVVAAPSQYEGGVGMVYLEAMACGRPVIAGVAGGSVEAVIDGETGFLAETGDVTATEAALRRLLSDRALRERMGRAGRDRVARYFAIEHYMERVLCAYERAIDRSRARMQRELDG